MTSIEKNHTDFAAANEVCAAASAKKTYTKPELKQFGSVSALTQGAGSCAPNDGAPAVSCTPGGTMAVFTPPASDIGLKDNIVKVGQHPVGFGLYLFDYKPGFTGTRATGRQFGVLAQEVQAFVPEAVCMHPDGYKVVDYARLGISLTQH